jgi:hypothetical protein
MGWLFSWSIFNRKEMIESLRRPERFGSGIELLHSTAVGNNHWYLAKTLETGKIWIGLDLMAGGGRKGEGWGYKDLTEHSGPYVYNCPLHFLDKASPATGYAVEWREKVRQYHAQRAARPVPKEGAVVEYGGHDYRLLRAASPRKGWHVIRTSDGVPFRMSASQLSKASFGSGIPA